MSEGNSYLGSLLNLGASAVKYASDTFASYVSDSPDLAVVDPDGKNSEVVDNLDANDRRQSFFVTSNFGKYIGMDITSLLSVPIWIMEPFTVTQKMAEVMEYSELLDTAADCEDPVKRHMYTVAFFISAFGCVERTFKPFNPILGETFEFIEEGKYSFFSEQVSHHPPIAAGHASSEGWTYDIVSAPSTKFLGNSVEVYPIGRTRVKLKRAGETYTVVPPSVKANNIVVGSSWIDVFGTLLVRCIETGMYSEIEFTPCGWFGVGRYEFSGFVRDKDGKPAVCISGMWNSHADAVLCDEEGEPLPGEEPVRLWTCAPKPEKTKYNFTEFAMRLNTVPEGAPEPLKSDSRRRPDRAFLVKGDASAAGEHKHRLEERQRAEKRERTRRGDDWQPRWFVPVPAEEMVSFEGECSIDRLGHWAPRMEFFAEQEQRPSVAMDEVDGKDFCPWQYPELPEGEVQ
mmetsp:Transcript_32697/g.77552  ORF Transcript_32697/g.77552 Transcript_32697/m.77552 type:complete len:457 (+) Transcript_32697:79-1449(+)